MYAYLHVDAHGAVYHSVLPECRKYRSPGRTRQIWLETVQEDLQRLDVLLG